jgi:cutinase
MLICEGTFSGKCTKNIVIFARGTTEMGSLGITVGPVLSSSLTGKDWSVVGVNYDADFAGDNCLGLPGGQVAKDMLNQAAQKCPNSKIFMSGYSEGAMVSHNGVAYADEESKKHVAVSLPLHALKFG